MLPLQHVCDVGAKILAGPEDKPWHLREFRVADLDGKQPRVFCGFAWELQHRKAWQNRGPPPARMRQQRFSSMAVRILLALALVSLAFAQSDKPAKPIKVSVNEVIVPVTVTDYKGRFVSNLEAKDFHIFDQDKEQRIEFFSHDRNQPLVVGFLVDLSNDSRVHWKNYQDAAIDLVLHILTGDKKYSGFLISYANEPNCR